MLLRTKLLTGMLATVQLVCPFANGMEVVVMESDGQSTVLDLPTSFTMGDLNHQLNGLISSDEGNWILVAAHDTRTKSPKAYDISDERTGYDRDLIGGARDYYYTPTDEDKANIGYVVKTLANKNEVALLLYVSSIETAGNKTAHVHPLKFLEVIFSDEELKVGMRNIRKKSLVWKKFRSGIADSLTDESGFSNMKVEYLSDFCNAVGLNINLVLPLYQQGQWKDFVDAVVTHVPRKGGGRDYIL